MSAFLAAALLLACTAEEEPVYEQFNAPDDILTVEVGAAELLPPVSIELWSNTGELPVGSASVDPGGGPGGTIHSIVVEVSDDYQDIVDRASVRTDSGERGEDEYDMVRDYADEGIYKLEIQSVADEGEIRTDTLTIRLWDETSGGDTG